MDSHSSAPAQVSASGYSSRYLFRLVQIGIGVALIAILLYRESIDVHALTGLRMQPWTVAAAAVLILLTLPIATLRWAIVLETLGVALPRIRLFHIVCIATAFNQLLFGPTSGDAVRGVYVWRILRRSSGRIALSIIVDRGLGALALIAVAAVLILLRWDRMQEVPQLMVLVLSVMASLVVGLIGGIALLAAPSLLFRSRSLFHGYPRIKQFLDQAQGVFMAFRRKPIALAAAFGSPCWVKPQRCSRSCSSRPISTSDHYPALDYLVSAPLALIANMLPFTPGGLGVGEAAFDQLCRWLEPSPSGAPYANIFFAFRAVSMLVLLVGIASFILLRCEFRSAGKF